MRPFSRSARSPTTALAAVLVGLGLLAIATLLHGLPARALPPVVDLDSTPAGLTVYGDAAYDGSGQILAAGDINGDTVDDLIIGAPSAHAPGGTIAGETYVFYGGPSLPSTIDLDSDSADLTVYGEDSGDRSSQAVAAGDINGDAIEDLLIGAWAADGSGSGTSCGGGQVGDRCEAGETYVIYGSATLGTEDGAGPGSCRDGVDNGADTLADGSDNDCYVDLDSSSPDLTVYGDDTSDHSGWSVACGDINGDGRDDLIIGADWADPAGGGGAGETYVFYGSATLGTEDGAGPGSCRDGVDNGADTLADGSDNDCYIDLDSSTADLTVYGDDISDSSGRVVAAGDINGDTTDDLIIAAPFADPAGGAGAGETYVIYGSATLGTEDGAGPGSCRDGVDNGADTLADGSDNDCYVDLDSSTADLTVYGDDAADTSGTAVAAGDISGDGRDDLIIGAYGADPAGGTEAGETYVIYGGTPGIDLPAPGGSIDLNSTSAGVTVYGDDADDFSGASVATGDIDGDATDDLIIGAHGADPTGGTDAGETYVIYGGTPGIDLPPVGGSIDLDSSSADLTVYGDDTSDHSGVAVAAGDINGDTSGDLIIGAYAADGSGSGTSCGAGQVGDRCQAGDTYVIYGDAPPTPTPTVTPTPTATPAPALKIGALFPFTGELEWIGDGLLNAAQLAADDVNAAGGVLGGTVQIVVGNTETDPAAGVSEATRLIDIEGADVIVGAASSGVTISVAEGVTVPGGVLQISPASTSPYISMLADDDLLFRTAASDAFQATVLAGLARERGYETASTIYVNDAYGQGLSEVFVEEFEALGGQVRGAVAHETGQPSYLAELATATAGNPDVLVAISYEDDASVYLAEAISNGLIDEFLFVDGTRSETMINAVCTAVGTPGCLDGMYGTAPISADTPAGLAFDDAYTLAYEEPPVVFARHAYDAVILTAFAAEAAASSDPALIRDALRGVSRPGGDVVGLADGGIAYALTLIRGASDVDYQGASGCVDLGVYGDVTCGWAEIWFIESDTIITDRIEPLEPAPAMISVDMAPDTPGVQAATDIDLDVISDFSIDVFVQGIPDPGLDSFSFDLVYDESRVHATAVLEGPFLARNGAGTSCSVQDPDFGPGRARLTCAVTGGTPALGDGALGTIQFDILPTPGGDPLSFVLENTSLTDAVASPVSHTTQDGSGDVIGVIETVAGTGEAGYYGDGGLATEAKLWGPRGVFETGSGSSTYFADTENHRVRKIDADGYINLVAGNGTGDYCGEGGAATSACLNRPHDVFVDGAGNVYIADTDNDVIRKVDTGGTITRVAGRGGGCVANPVPPHDGCLATEAVLDGPRGVALDDSGNIYIADTENHRIRRIDAGTQVISTVAGNGAAGFSGDGDAATAAGLKRPHDVYVYGELGDFVIADTDNNRIRRVDGFTGVIDTIAGSGLASYGGDGGLATLADLNGPEAVAVDSADSRLPNVLIADTQNNRIRRIDGRSAVITTVAGNGTAGSGGDGGPATQAQLNLPSGVAVGSLTVGDTGNNTLRAVDPSTGKPSGRFSGLSCTVGSVSTADWVLVGFVLGLVVARRRIRGLMMQIRLLAGLAAWPGMPG